MKNPDPSVKWTEDYKWFAFDGEAGNDVCVRRLGGRYYWSIHDFKYPDAPTCYRSRSTPEKALEAARRAFRRYRRPFQEAR